MCDFKSNFYYMINWPTDSFVVKGPAPRPRLFCGKQDSLQVGLAQILGD